MFDLTELKKLADKQKPSGIVIPDTNILMDYPYILQWISPDKFIVVVSTTVHEELVMKKNRDKQPETREKARIAAEHLNRLTNGKGEITKGIEAPKLGWFIAVSDPDKNALDEEIKKYELLYKGLNHSDMKLLFLARECQEALHPSISTLATGDKDLSGAARLRSINSYLFTEHQWPKFGEQWSKLSNYIEQIRLNTYTDDMDEALAYVYVAQLVRPDGPERAGVLKEDCRRYDSEVKRLLSIGYIQEKHCAGHEGFITTQKGKDRANAITANRLSTHKNQMEAELARTTRRCLQYLQAILYFIDKDFPTGDPGREVDIREGVGQYEKHSNDNPYRCLLSNREICDMRDHLFDFLAATNLVVKARPYAVGGKVHGEHYVPAPELRSFFRDYLAKGEPAELWPKELEGMHSVFHILGYLNMTMDELNKKIPVLYRESVKNFIDECVNCGAVKKSANGLVVDDTIWYDDQRTKRFQQPLIDFLLGHSPSLIVQTREPTTIEESVFDHPVASIAKESAPIRVGNVLDRETKKRDTRDRRPTSEPKDAEGGVKSGPSWDGLRIFLGITPETQRGYWCPGDLNNGHLIIVGGSGAGKTELIRCIAADISDHLFPVLMIDFHGDMAPANAVTTRYDIREESPSYFNPLELSPKYPEITPLRATSDFMDAMAINFPTIGVQQKNRLKDIVKQGYSQVGITNDMGTWSRELPFAIVQQEIEESNDSTTETLRAYLDDIFAFTLFSGSSKFSIDEVLKPGITHINLKQLPESLRSLYADLFLRKLR